MSEPLSREALEARYEYWFKEATSARGRAIRAEAGLLAAQEALKAQIAKYDHGADECAGECVPDRNAVVADLRDALARGGGQQDTG